jgi:hypothetical protein
LNFKGINSKQDKDPIDSIERPSSPSPCLTLLPWSGNPTGAERFSQGGRRGAGAQSGVSCSLNYRFIEYFAKNIMVAKSPSHEGLFDYQGLGY